jgi:Eisosome component PIL1
MLLSAAHPLFEASNPTMHNSSSMAFKPLLPRPRDYGLSYDSARMLIRSLGHALRKQTAGQFGPDLAKKLSQLVKMEKNVMRSMELVGRERMEVAVSY